MIKLHKLYCMCRMIYICNHNYVGGKHAWKIEYGKKKVNSNLRKAQKDIPIPISNFFHAPYILMKDAVPKLPIPIYNQNQEPNPTRNISLILDSKRQLVVLVLCILISNKKSLEMAHVPKMKLDIRN